ncbi:MAG: curli-like amyloid fiber formation chaperone CsgH [Hyphomonas sp.]
MKYAMIGAALALASACAAQTPPATHTVSEPGACEIRETRTANGLRLEAVAHADYGLRADYTFKISAHSTDGSSDVTQGGPVDLVAGESAVIGGAEISRGRYRALLTLTDAAGELCRLERRA